MTAHVLHAPHPEQVATSNAWAFLQWVRATGRGDVEGWEGLIAWSAADPAGFSDALAGFAGLPPNSLSAPRGGEGRGEVGEPRRALEAARLYGTDPTALRLRQMNLLYEMNKDRGATILIPTDMASSLGALLGVPTPEAPHPPLDAPPL